MNKKLILICIIVAIFILGIAIYSFNSKINQKTEESANITPVVDVKVIHPEIATDGLFIEAQGRVTANSVYSVPALSDGKINKVFINTGDPVGKGQVIATLSNPEANSDIAVLQNKLNVNQNAINTIEGKLRDSQEMVHLGIVAKNDVRNIQNELSTRKLERQDILSPVNKLKIRQNNYRVASNYSGYVSSVLPEGSFVAYGQTIASIIALNKEYIEASIPVDQVASIKTRQRVLISSNGIDINGYIKNVFPIASSNLIKVLVQPEKPLPAGMDVKVKVKRADINGFVIPKSAVIMNEGKPVVFLIKNGKAYMRTIQIQKDYTDKVIVSQGLEKADSIATDNAYLLEDKMKVNVK